MIIRALDGNHDFQFGQSLQSYLTDNAAIAENVQTRLLSFLNDCFFDMGAGIDWFRLMGSKNTLQEILLTIRAVILSSYGVVKVNSITPSVSASTRKLSVTYSIDTIFSKSYSQTIQVP